MERMGINKRIKPKNIKKIVREIGIFKKQSVVTYRIRKHSYHLLGKHIPKKKLFVVRLRKLQCDRNLPSATSETNSNPFIS